MCQLDKQQTAAAVARAEVMREALDIYEDIVKNQQGLIDAQRLVIQQLLNPSRTYAPGEKPIG